MAQPNPESSETHEKARKVKLEETHLTESVSDQSPTLVDFRDFRGFYFQGQEADLKVDCIGAFKE